MKRLCALLSLMLFWGGCVKPGIAPQEEQLTSLEGVRIVAMEPPPLGVPPVFHTTNWPPPSPVEVLAVGPIGLIFFLVYIHDFLNELPEISEQGGEISQSFQDMLDQRGFWVPTIVLANEVQKQLTEQGFMATVAPYVKPIPGVEERTYTVFMENWLAPIRAWYNDYTPLADYVDLSSDQSLKILEVGVINYEIMSDGGLLLQVAMKLIDPSNGHVIGRARASNALNITPTKITSLGPAFSGDASSFKEAFQRTGQDMTNKCLIKLGLLNAGHE